MAKNTAISWAHHSWNPWWGCLEVSAGCDFCYARLLAERWGHQVWGPPHDTSRRLFGDAHWAEPRRWDRAAAAAGERRRVFCASMGDVFEVHPMLDAERRKLWILIEETPWLDWLLLTKRPEQIGRMLPPAWLTSPRPNVWLGTSVEDQAAADLRIPRLLSVPAAVHWLSCEPLLGPVDLTPWLWESPVVDWVIVGGESGPRYRPMDVAWARALRDQCQQAGTAFWFKQGANRLPGRDVLLDGRKWEGVPHAAL